MNKGYGGFVAVNSMAEVQAPPPSETLMQVLGECLSLTVSAEEQVDSLKVKLFGEQRTTKGTEVDAKRSDVDYVARVLRERLYAVREQVEYLNNRVQ